MDLIPDGIDEVRSWEKIDDLNQRKLLFRDRLLVDGWLVGLDWK